MDDNIIKKRFGEVKKGDMLYTLTYNKATVVIHKLEVTGSNFCCNGKSVEIRFGKDSRLYAHIGSSRIVETYQFGKWIVTTTLEEAKELCITITENKIKEHKKAIETAKQRIKKWEKFKTLLDKGIYNIK